MPRFISQFWEPLQTIKTHPMKFAVWIAASLIFGLVGFWVTLIAVFFIGLPLAPQVLYLIKGGTLASFAVTLLAEGIISSLNSENTGRNETAAGIRSLSAIFALALILTQVVLWATNLSVTDARAHSLFNWQAVMTALSVLMAIYLFCFRYAEWERDVSEFQKSENDEVLHLQEDASKQATDDSGTKL